MNYWDFINMKDSEVVLSTRSDVTGDNIPDNIYIIGTKTSNSPFIQEIALIIQDGRTGKLTKIPLEDNIGYNPYVFLGDFTGNGVDDIMIGISSGGSGGIMYYYIFSNLMNQPKMIFNHREFNESNDYSVVYKDNYKVKIDNNTRNVAYLVDLSLRDKKYLDEVYDSDGKLKKTIQGFVNPLSGLYPIDFNSDGIFNLVAFQKVAGRYNADAIGYIESMLEWDKDEFNIYNQYVGINGYSE